MKLNKENLTKIYRKMKTIRAFEERLHDEILTGAIAGFTHLYAGQEAVAVGVCEQLNDNDYISSTHRGHGHCLAKGCDVIGMMKEIYGCRDGLGKGRGGSMHIADINVGMLGANGIVGAGAPIGVGAGITAKKHKGVSIVFSGDGACNQGTTFEAMNMAVVLKLPVIFVYENNHYSEHTGVDYAVGAKNMHSRAAAFGMRAEFVQNGMDFFDVNTAMAELIQYCRDGNGPAAIEIDTERFYGHFEGDPQNYRGDGELVRLRKERDCIAQFRATMKKKKTLSVKELDAIDVEVMDLIDEAVKQSVNGEKSTADHVTEDVYISY